MYDGFRGKKGVGEGGSVSGNRIPPTNTQSINPLEGESEAGNRTPSPAEPKYNHVGKIIVSSVN